MVGTPLPLDRPWHVPCCLVGMLWLALTQERGPISRLAEQVARLVAFADEVAARLSAAGLEGIGGAAEASRRLASALEHVSRDEIERMLVTIDALEDELGAVLQQLEGLKRLKRSIGELPPTS
jgi:hypothetical protein